MPVRTNSTTSQRGQRPLSLTRPSPTSAGASSRSSNWSRRATPNSQLACMLWVTGQTVIFHLSNICRKSRVATGPRRGARRRSRWKVARDGVIPAQWSVGIELPFSAGGAIENCLGGLVVGQVEPPALLHFEPRLATLLAATRLRPCGRRSVVHDSLFRHFRPAAFCTDDQSLLPLSAGGAGRDHTVPLHEFPRWRESAVATEMPLF